LKIDRVLVIYKIPLSFKILYSLAICLSGVLSFFFILGFIIAGIPFIPVSPSVFYVGIACIFIFSAILILWSVVFTKGYKVRLAVNNEGLYVDFFMWFSSVFILWKDVVDLQTKPYSRIGIFKKKCVLLSVKKGLSIKLIPVLCDWEVSGELFQELSDTIQSYIDKYKKGDNSI